LKHRAASGTNKYKHILRESNAGKGNLFMTPHLPAASAKSNPYNTFFCAAPDFVFMQLHGTFGAGKREEIGRG